MLCRLSSVVEQHFCKVKVLGSNPRVGSILNCEIEGCSICGWKQKNLVTGRIPLEIDHVNGNAEDNSEQNLRLICPNCHSLSSNFRNLNKGKGRSWRIKYLKSINLIK